MNLDKIKPTKQLIEAQDLLLLSKQYQDKGEYKKSADLIREYKKLMKEEVGQGNLQIIEKKIDYLDSMLLNTAN